MNEFLQLNKNKLRTIFTRLSIVLLGLVSVILIIAYLTGSLPNEELLLFIILSTGIFLPLFLVCLGYISWWLHQRTRQKAFSKAPFNQIENIGFYTAYMDERSKWAFTEAIKEAKINGFVLRMNVSEEDGIHFIEFDIPVEWKKIEKKEYNHLTEKFKQYNAAFRIGSIVKKYDTREKSLQTVSDLRQDLELFTTLLRQEGFEPKI